MLTHELKTVQLQREIYTHGTQFYGLSETLFMSVLSLSSGFESEWKYYSSPLRIENMLAYCSMNPALCSTSSKEEMWSSTGGVWFSNELILLSNSHWNSYALCAAFSFIIPQRVSLHMKCVSPVVCRLTQWWATFFTTAGKKELWFLLRVTPTTLAQVHIIFITGSANFGITLEYPMLRTVLGLGLGFGLTLRLEIRVRNV